MSDNLVWFFAITGFVMSLANNIVGIWDLIIDMRNYKHDSNALSMKEVIEPDDKRDSV